MSNIFSSSFGGMKVTPSATSQANIIKGQASMQEQKDTAFADKLKKAQEKATELNSSTNPKDPNEQKKLREACQELESVFLNMMLGKMRDTIPERTLFPKSSGEKMMQSMLDVELTRVMAKGKGMGLADMLYKQLSNPGVKSVDK